MKDVTDMARAHGRKLATIGATALAATALAAGGPVVGGTPEAASAAPVAFAKPAVVAAPAGTASVVAAAAYAPPKRNLAPGMKGSDVKAFQQRLWSLRYYLGKIDGQFGASTQAALWAFQEINGIKVTGVVDAATKARLVHPKAYKSPSYPGKRATRVEVSQALEVLVLFKDNKVSLISHVSSGGGYFYGSGAQAVTPNGTYNTTAYMPGWVTVPLGEMYNPVFFISTVFAIHGDTYVPQGPASHGCIRVPMIVADVFHKQFKTPGTQVHVYGKPQWEK